jgi:hypothetical protein
LFECLLFDLQAMAAGEDSVDFLAATPQTTSLSIARALATGSPRHPSSRSNQLQQQQQQQLDGQQQQQQQQPAQFFNAYGLASFGTAQEQFLQMLQQDLAKVGMHGCSIAHSIVKLCIEH